MNVYGSYWTAILGIIFAVIPAAMEVKEQKQVFQSILQ